MKFPDGKTKCRYCRAAFSTSSGSTGYIRRYSKSKHTTVPLGRVEPKRSQSPSSSGEGADCSCLGAVAKPFRYEEPTIGLFRCIGKWFAPPVSTSMASSTLFSALTPRSSQLSQSSLTRFVAAVGPVLAQKKRTLDVQLLKMTCKEYHPFSLVKDVKFRKLLNILNPNYVLPNRRTLK